MKNEPKIKIETDLQQIDLTKMEEPEFLGYLHHSILMANYHLGFLHSTQTMWSIESLLLSFECSLKNILLSIASDKEEDVKMLKEELAKIYSESLKLIEWSKEAHATAKRKASESNTEKRQGLH